MTDVSAGSGGADRQRKGRWRRATQVCTNCRQMKLRCDFQERFPEPCTRCASAGHARGMPCHVDPSFRRTAQRASDNIPFAVAAAKTSPPHADERKSSPNIFSQPVSQELFHENITPPSSISDPDCLPRTLGRVTLSPEEVDGLFVEFFGYYHRFLPVFVEPVSPDEAFDMSHYLFWAICSIASRRRPDHPVMRARDSEFCMSIGQEVQLLFPQMVLAPHASYHLVQALILICEFPPLTINGRNGFIWVYSGMAITLGTAVGLHRHYFHTEYLGLHDHDRDLDVDERRERILTWIQCFNVHQSCASLRGAPSLINDDYLLVKAATSPVETMTKKIINEPDVFHSLRINRLTRRLMLAVGNDASTPSGLAEPSMRKPLVAMFASDLADVESSLKPGPDSALSPISAVRLLGAKLQLHAFELHDSAENASAEDLLICYTSAIRIITTLSSLYKNPESRSIFWPRSIYVTFVAASLCLLKVATLQMYSPRKINIEQAIILKELAAAYDIMKSRSIYPGDIAERRALGLRLLCSHLQNAAPLTNHSTPGIGVRSRMSLGGLLYDSIVQVKNLRASKTPGVEGVFIKQEDTPSPLKSARTSKSPSGKQATATGTISQQLHTQAPPMPPAHAQVTNQSLSFVNGVGPQQPVPSPSQHAPRMVQTSSCGMDDSSVHDINRISWDGTDIYNLPTTETAEWLQFFSVENCAEVMSVPGYNHDFVASWQMQDAPMPDPFNFAIPPDQSSLRI